MTNFDETSIGLSVVALILGFLSVIIIGSQTHEDARFVATCTHFVFIPLLLVSCARLAISSGGGGPGMVVLCSGSIVAIEIGYWIAKLRDKASQSELNGQKSEPGLWDDELF